MAGRVTQSAIEIILLDSPHARLTQSAVEIVVLQNPHARVTQSVIEILTVPGTPIPPAPPIFTAVSGGGNAGMRPIRDRGGCDAPPTRWDDLLERDGYLMRRIVFPPLCVIPEEYRNLLPWDDESGAIPAQSSPINVTGGILTPAPAAGDQVMISYRVPKGFQGLLAGIYFQYSGLGFTQGSGDILFRIKVNQRYMKDLSNVPYLLGSSVFPLPLTEGQLLWSDQLLEAIVNVPNLSGLIQAGSSRCYAGMFGFIWPMG